MDALIAAAQRRQEASRRRKLANQAAPGLREDLIAILRPARNVARRAPERRPLFTLDCPRGCSEALTPNPDDSEVLAYLVSYHTYCEGCECGEGSSRDCGVTLKAEFGGEKSPGSRSQRR
jgi:hypothetical protein